MQIEMLKTWHWRGSMLKAGQVIVMPPRHCEPLLRAGVAREVLGPEAATVTAQEQAIKPRPRKRGRPRRATPS